jgi:phage-related protein
LGRLAGGFCYLPMGDLLIAMIGERSQHLGEGASGVNEIRIYEDGEHRVLYVAKFSEAIFVLHCFEKKTQKTAKKDIELANKRYKAVAREQAK